MYTAQLLETVSELQGFAADWSVFLSNGKQPHFHHNIERLIIEKETYDQPQNLIIIVIRQNGEPVSMLPLLFDQRPFKLVLGLITLGSVNFRRYRVLGNQILMRDECDQKEVLQFLSEYLVSFKRKFDFIFFTELPLDNSLFHHSQALSPYVVRPWESSPQTYWVLKINGEHEDFLKSLTSKTRYALKKNLKNFQQSCNNDYQIVKIHRPEQVEVFIADCSKIYVSSWKAHTMGKQKSPIETDMNYLKNIAKKGWLRSYILYCKDKPVAFASGYQYAGTYYGDDMAFDNKFKKQAPGSVLFYLLVKDLFQFDQPENFELGYGESRLKKIYSNSSFTAIDSFVVRKYSKPWLLVELQIWLRKIYDAVHYVLTKLNLDSHIRRRFKH